ncbi:hypothetical protein SteCoe_15118 [Stentor coeruleus]|uniref:Uncharacterized protein n=1 Tax=Stentor coeruleus TaxID=5963 RepID=A0A1R2C4I8_9CILI|nr:hypothetical protein SteCoe_15118 [Stentor coeruleus]
MFDNFEVTIIRVEGLGNISKASCCVYMNDELADSVSIKDLESAQHICTVPSKGEIRFSVEDLICKASVRFDINIIKCQGYHWLPMFPDGIDIITEVPEEVGLPRILLIFQSRKFLSPVIEITETSEISENVEYAEITEVPTEEISKNVELRMKIMDLEQNIQLEKFNQIQNIDKITRDYKANLDKLNFEVEKYKIWSEKYKTKCTTLSEDLDKKSKLLLDSEDEKEMLKAELNLYKTKHSELIIAQEKMHQILNSKDKEISLLKAISEVQKKDFECVSQECVSVVQKKEQKKKKSKLIDFSIEKKPIDAKQFETLDNADIIQMHLQENLSKLKLEGFFSRSNEQYYKVGCKKVAVVLKNGSIYCKIGDTYKTLENYIYAHCTQELENFIKKRANSKPGHRRYHTFSNSFDNTLTVENKIIKPEPEPKKILRGKNKSITPQLARNSKSKLLS